VGGTRYAKMDISIERISTRMMRRFSNRQWWILFSATVLVVLAWPPDESKSLATKLVNWAVDPRDELPILLPQLPLAMGDDPEAVEIHDAEVRRYDALFLQGGWLRKRLELKAAGDPFDRVTTRQILVAIWMLAALICWRLSSRRDPET
jgi:hypothetical protein